MVRETRHLWVGNLPDNIREERILEHFKRYGRVQSVKLLPKRDEEVGLGATVAFIDIKSASKAHGSDNKIEERTLKTDYYEPPSSSTATIHIHERDDNLLRAGVLYTPNRNQRYPHGLSEDRGGYDRSSHYYERTGERDPYMRRPMSYHEEEVYQGRGRTRERTGTNYRAATTGFQTPLERIPGHYRTHNSRQHFDSTQLPQQPASQPPLQPAQPRYAADQYNMDDRESVSGSRRSSPSRAKVRHGRPRPKSTSRSRSQSGSESPSRSGSRSSCGSRSSSSSSNTRSSSSSDCTHSCSGSGSRSQSPSRAGAKSLRPPDKIASVASPAPQLQSAVSTPNPPPPQQPVSCQATSNDTLLSISSSPPEKEDKRPLGICVRNLPVRSSDTSLKDGLFHEYKKHGKVTTVKVIGQGTDRYAVVCFKKPEDVEKALEVSKDKLFFGSKIEVTSHEGLDVEDNEFRPLEAELDEFHPKATRTLFIGNLEKDITTAELRKHFEQFGEIIEIDIKKQGAVSSYAFVQYSDIGSVVKAMRKMDGEHLGANRIKLGFGKSMPTNCVWLDGIADTISEKFLMRQFVRFGHVVSTYIDREKGHALVFYERVEYAQIAVPEMRGRALGGKKLQIDFASRECQVAFFEKMEMSGQMLPGDRPWDRREQTFENREEREVFLAQAPTESPRIVAVDHIARKDPRLTFETPGRGFGRFDNQQRGRANFRAGQRGTFASRGRGQGFANRTFDEEFPQGTGTTYDDSYEQELREYGFSQRERRDYSSDDHGRGFSPRRRREDCSMSPKDRLSDSLGASPHPRIERSASRYDSGREDEIVDEKRPKFYELDKDRPVKKSRQRSVSDQESYHSQSPPNSRHQSRSISPLPKEKRPKERPVNRPLSPGNPLDSPSRDSLVSLEREATTEFSVKRKLSESRTDLLREASRSDFVVEVDNSARSRTKIDSERSKFRKVLSEEDGGVDRRDCSRESTPSYKDRASSVFRVGDSVKLPSVISLNTRLQKVTAESEQSMSLDVESSDKMQVEDNDRESGELVDDFLDKTVPETSAPGLKHLQKEKVHILHLLEHLEHPSEKVLEEAEKRLCKKVKVNDASRQNSTKDTKDLLPSLLAKVPDLDESTGHKKLEVRRVGVELTKPLEIKTKCSLVEKVDVIRSVSDVSDEVAFVIECSPKDIPAETHSHKRRRSGVFPDNAGLTKLLYRTKNSSDDPLGLNNTDEDVSSSEKLTASKVSGDARLLNLKSPDSKPGTPLVDEPRREKETPLSLPLPRFASCVMSPKPLLSPKSSLLKSPLLSPTGSNSHHVVLPAGGRESATVADVLVRSNSVGGSLPDKKISAPGLETRHKSPVSLSPKCSALRAAKASGLDSSSDSEHSPRCSPSRPSLEERIRILDEKFNAWSGSTRSVSSNASLTSVTNTLNRIDCEKFKKRPSFLSTDITQLRTEPSDIVKSLLAKNSIFDQDSKRLEHVNEKYQPREVTIDPAPKKTFCFRTKAAAKEFLPAFTTASTPSRTTNTTVALPTARYPFPSTPTTTASTMSSPVTTLSSSTATTNTTPSTVMACHVSHGSTLCSSSSTTSYPAVPFSPITPVSTALPSPSILRQSTEPSYKTGSAVNTRKPSTEMPKTPILKKEPPSTSASHSTSSPSVLRTSVTTSATVSNAGSLIVPPHTIKKEPNNVSVPRRDSVGSSSKKEPKEQLVVKKELSTINCSSAMSDLLKRECSVVLSCKDANKRDFASSASSREFKKEVSSCVSSCTTRELTSPPLIKKEPSSSGSCSSKENSSKREPASGCVTGSSGKENSRKESFSGNNNSKEIPQRRDSSSQGCNKRRLVSADSSESDSSRISLKTEIKSDRENKSKCESSRHQEPEAKKPKLSSTSSTEERKRSECVTSPSSQSKKCGKSPQGSDKKSGKSDSKSEKKEDKERKSEMKSSGEEKSRMDGSKSKDEKRNKFSKDNKELLSKCECRPKSKSIKDKDKKKDKKKDRKDKSDKDKSDKDRSDKSDKDKGDKDKGDKDKGDKDKGDRSKSDKDKGDKEKGERDKSDKDKSDKDKGEKDKSEKDKSDKDKTDKDKCENDKPKEKRSGEKSKSEGSRRDRKSEKCLNFWEEEPVYFSMYDKVKARSSQNEKAKEKEKELETMREKFSQLKQSRAKREEKVRPSCDYDSDRGSDAGSFHSSETSESKLSVSKGKQHGKKRKPIIASDSEDGDASKEGSSKFGTRHSKTSDEDDFKYEDISECEGLRDRREPTIKCKPPRDMHLVKSENDSTDTELLKFRDTTLERKHKTKGRKKHDKGENRMKLKKKSEDESSDVEGSARTKLHNLKRDKTKKNKVVNSRLSEDESGDSETALMLKEIGLLQSAAKEEDQQQLYLSEMDSKPRKPSKKESKRKKEKTKGVFADIETSEDEHREKMKITKRKKSRKSSRSKENKFQEDHPSIKNTFEGDGNCLDGNQDTDQLLDLNEHSARMSKDGNKSESDSCHKVEQSHLVNSFSDDSLPNIARLEKPSRSFNLESDKSDSEPLMPQLIHKEDHEELSELEARDNSDKYLGSPPMDLLEAKALWMDDSLPTDDLHTPSLTPTPKLSSTSSKVDDKTESETDQATKNDDFKNSLPTLPPYDLDLNMPSLIELPVREERRHRKSKKASKDRKRRSRDEAPKLEDVYTLTAVNMEPTTPLPSSEPEEIIPEKITPVTVEEPKSRLPDSAELVEAVRILESQLQQTTHERNKMDDPVPCHTETPAVEDNAVVTADTAVASIIDDDDDDNDDDKAFAKLVVDESRLEDDDRSDHEKDVLDTKQSALDVFEFTDDDIPEIPAKFGRDDHRRSRLPEDEVDVRVKKHKGKRRRKTKEDKTKKSDVELCNIERALEPSEDEKEVVNEAKNELLDLPLLKEEVSVDKQSAVHDIIPDLLAATESIPLPDLQPLHDQKTEAESEQESDDKTASAISQEETEDAVKALLQACTFGTDSYDNQDSNMLDEDDMVPKLEPMVGDMEKVEADDDEAERAAAVLSLEDSVLDHLTDTKDIEPLVDETPTFQDSLHKDEGELGEPLGGSKDDIANLQEDEITTIPPPEAVLESSHSDVKDEALENLVIAANVLSGSPHNSPEAEAAKSSDMSLVDTQPPLEDNKDFTIDKDIRHSPLIPDDVASPLDTDKQVHDVMESSAIDQLDESNEAKITDTEEMEDETKIKVIEEIVKMLDCEKTDEPTFETTDNKALLDVHHPITPPLIPLPPPLPPPPLPPSPPPLPVQPVPVERAPVVLPPKEEEEKEVPSPKCLEPLDSTELPQPVKEIPEATEMPVSSELPVCVPSPKPTPELETQSRDDPCPVVNAEMPILDNMEEKEESEKASVIVETRSRRARRGKGRKHLEPIINLPKSEPAITVETPVVNAPATPRTSSKRGRRNQRIEVEPPVEPKDNLDNMPLLEESSVTDDKITKDDKPTKSFVCPEEDVPHKVTPEVKVADSREEMPPLLESSLEEPVKPPTHEKQSEELIVEKSLDIPKAEEPRNKRRGRKKKNESHVTLPSPPTLEKMEVKIEEVEELKAKENRFDARLKTPEPKSTSGAKDNMFDVFEFRDDEEDDNVTFFESSKERKDDHKFSEVRFHVESESIKREEPERPIEPVVREEKEVATVERTRPRLILTIKSPHKDSHEKVAKVETREEPAVRIVEHRTDDHRGDSFSTSHSTIVSSRSESAEHGGSEKGTSSQSPNKCPATRKSQRLQEKSYRTTIDEVIEDVVKGHFHTMDEFEHPANATRSTRRTRSRGRVEDPQPTVLPEKVEVVNIPQVQDVSPTLTTGDITLLKPELPEEEPVADLDPTSGQQDTSTAAADTSKPSAVESSEVHRPVSLRTFRITRTQCRSESGKAEFQASAIIPQDNVAGATTKLESPETKEDEPATKEVHVPDMKTEESMPAPPAPPAHIKDTLPQLPKDSTSTDIAAPTNDAKSEGKGKLTNADKPIPLQTQLVMKVELPKVSQAVPSGKINNQPSLGVNEAEQVNPPANAPTPSAGGEEKEADSSPTALVDPVTGFLTPVRQSEEGTYIPAMTTSTTLATVTKDGSSISTIAGAPKALQPPQARSPVVVCPKSVPLAPPLTVAVTTTCQMQMPPPATTSAVPVARSPQPLSQLALLPKSPHSPLVQRLIAGVKEEPEQALQSRSRSQSLPRLATAFVGEPPVDIGARGRSQSLSTTTVLPDHDNRLLHPSVVSRPPPPIGQPMPGLPSYTSPMAGLPSYPSGSYPQQTSVHAAKAASPHPPVVSGYAPGSKTAASLKPPTTSPVGVIGMPPVATTAVSVVKTTAIASSKINASGRVSDPSSVVRVTSAEAPVVYKTEPGIAPSTCAGKVPSQRSSDLLSQPHIMSDMNQPRVSKAQAGPCSASKSSGTPRHSPVIPQQASYPIPAYETALHTSHTYGPAATGGGGIPDLLQNPNYLLQHKNYPLAHHSPGQLLERVPNQIVRPGNPVAVHPEVAARLGNPTPPHTPTPPTHPSITGQTDMIHLRHPSQPMVVHPHHTHSHMPAYVHSQLVYANHPHYALHPDLRAQQAAALQGMQARMPYATSTGSATMRHPPDSKMDSKEIRAETKHAPSVKEEKLIERQDDRSMAVESNRPSTSDPVSASRNQPIVAVGQPPVRQPQAQYPSVIPPLRQVTPHLAPSPHDRATDSPIIAILYNKPTRHPYPRSDQDKLPAEVRTHEGDGLHARSMVSQPSMVYLDPRTQTGAGSISSLTKQDVHRQSQQPPLQQARSRSPAASMRPPSPPPAHIRSLGGNYLQSGCTPQPGSEAPMHPVLVAQPIVQPRTQLQTPPHASQVPPQGDSLLMLLQRYPVMWQGLLALKNDQAAVQMHFVSGNHNVALHSLPSMSEGGTPPLRIAQRMRLEQTQLEGVARRMQMEGEHCMLLALPCGRDHMDVLQQSNNLRNGFITYLQQKQAAGIVNVAAPGSQQPAYVVHIFPSCEFSNENLARIAPDLLHSVADIAHLLIVVATV